MATGTLVSLEEYLTTSYRPDCDYVDGVLEERNVGQYDHSRLQTAVPLWFWLRRRALGLEAFVALRIRVSASRCRVPDVCVVSLPEPDEQVLTHPPYIVIEVLSPEDRLTKVQERADDFLAMGVPNVWLLDPASRRGWHVTRQGHLEATDGILRTSDGRVSLPIADLFALDST